MRCPRCGGSVSEAQNFCGDCGSPLPIRCKACGTDNPPGKKFCADCGTLLAPAFAEGRAAGAYHNRPPEAEHRQLTVMFADLVGSTMLGIRLDPEDLRSVIISFQECITSVVARFGGFVARYMGDGVLVYFGFPQAHENDAERAIHAALSIVEAVQKLRTVAGPAGTLASRVGIATGPVVVGDVVGFGSSLEAPVVGNTPNLAAGLITMAEPNTVVVAETTHSLTGELFDYKIVGPKQLKGHSTPIFAWAALAEKPIDSRFEALRIRVLPLVGRIEELGLFLHRWEQAKAGEGSVVFLTGEPGIGKSRLVASVEKTIGLSSPKRLRFICSPIHQDSPLYPIIHYLELAAALARSDPPPEKLSKLTRLLNATDSSDPDIEVFANLLSIPPMKRDLPANPSKQNRKEAVLGAIVRQFERLVKSDPLFVIIEDIHWADPTTLELIELLIEKVEKLPMLLVITSRTELKPTWVTRSEVTFLMLSGFSRYDASSLIQSVAEGRILQEEVVNRIIAHADGIPLYIEELTKTVLDAADTQPQSLTEVVSPSVVPATLQAAMMSRLDRLNAAKDVAQTASVIGREFTFETLQRLSNISPSDLEGALCELEQTGLASARDRPPYSTYFFKHALVRDAAYASLLRERRRTIHLRLAELLTEDYTNADGPLPEVIAWHFGEAGDASRSIDYYLKAAERATGRFALTERVNYLRKCVQQVKYLSQSIETQRRELSLQVALYQALVDEKGSGSEDVRCAVERARALCYDLGDTRELIRVQDGLFNYHFSHSQPEMLFHYSNEISEFGQKTGNPQAVIMARKTAGFANLLKGRFEAACEDMRLLLETYDEERDGHSSLAVRDPRVGAYTVLGICLTVLGYLDSGAAKSLEAIRYAESLSHPVSQIIALRRACVQSILQRDEQTVLRLSERLLSLASEFETFKGARDGTIFNCWAQLRTSRDPVLLGRMRSCIEEFDATQYWALLPFFMTSAAEIMATHFDLEGATALLNRAAELVNLTGEQWSEPELIRVRAVICRQDMDVMVSLLHLSLDKAKRQNAKLWELRSATSLASAWLKDGNNKAARELLAPIITWFTEGLQSPDLIAARELLAQAGGTLDRTSLLENL